ncbi:transposase [Stygiolobus sp. CP8521M]|uniref:transposase n=1 Tax=Stygiolobus sp. CP8521M TaxID=3133136 RepID=UPI00307E8D22
MTNRKGQVEYAKERLVKAVNQVLGVIRRNGRSRKVRLALALMVLLGGRSSVKNAAETFGLDYANLLEALGELKDAWRDYLKVLSGLVKGEVVVIIDDTVDHKEYSRGKDVSPHGNYWIYCHAHRRFERVKLLTVAIVDLSTGRTFMVGAFPYAVRKMLDLGMVNEFKTKIDLAKEMLDVLKGYFRVSKVVFDSWYWSEKLVTDNVVSELKSNRRLLRVESARGTLEEVEGHLRVGDLPPGVYYADLTLRDRVTTVKLLVQEYKGDSGTHVKYLYTTDLSLSEEEMEEAWRMRWEIEKLHRDVKALGLEDSSFWRRERLQGYLTIFTIMVNVVRELIGELNLRSVEAFLRFVERYLGGPSGLMKIFKLR